MQFLKISGPTKVHLQLQIPGVEQKKPKIHSRRGLNTMRLQGFSRQTNKN